MNWEVFAACFVCGMVMGTFGVWWGRRCTLLHIKRVVEIEIENYIARTFH